MRKFPNTLLSHLRRLVFMVPERPLSQMVNPWLEVCLLGPKPSFWWNIWQYTSSTNAHTPFTYLQMVKQMTTSKIIVIEVKRRWAEISLIQQKNIDRKVVKVRRSPAMNSVDSRWLQLKDFNSSMLLKSIFTYVVLLIIYCYYPFFSL